MECPKCGNKVMVTDEECPRCGEKVTHAYDQSSADTQKVTNMMGKGKPITAIVPKEHIDPVQYAPGSGSSAGASAPPGTSSVHVSTTLTGSMVIGMIAAVVLFCTIFMPVVGVKIDIPGMPNIYNKSYSLIEISSFMSHGDSFNMFGTNTAFQNGGIALILLRHAATIVVILSIASLVLSFIRLYVGVGICGIITIILSGYGIVGFYRLLNYFAELGNKGNDAPTGYSTLFNPSSLLDMVHLQFGIWVIMLAGVLLLVAAFFPKAD